MLPLFIVDFILFLVGLLRSVSLTLPAITLSWLVFGASKILFSLFLTSYGNDVIIIKVPNCAS